MKIGDHFKHPEKGRNRISFVLDFQESLFKDDYYRVLHKKQPSDRTVDSSVIPRAPPTSKLFLAGCRSRPSEKTAIQVRYVQPFSVATLKWGLEGATNVRSLSRAMAVFF